MDNPLGRCDREGCYGELCVMGDEVRCESCGFPQVDHALAVEFRSRPQEAPRPEVVAQPIEYVASWGDRILALEKRAAAQDARIAKLEKIIAGGNRKTG